MLETYADGRSYGLRKECCPPILLKHNGLTGAQMEHAEEGRPDSLVEASSMMRANGMFPFFCPVNLSLLQVCQGK